jgi:hypothetical protein
MKNPLLIIIPLILLGIASCKKMDNSSVNISEADAANVIAGSLATNSNGLASISSDMSANSGSLAAVVSGCGVTKLDSISHQSPPGSTTTYGYKLKYSNKLFCNTNNQPDNVTSNLTFAGYFNGPRVLLTHSGSTTFVIAGLTTNATVYSINGEYKSTGSFKLKADTTNAGTINIDIVVKNYVITKTAITSPSGITGGTATVTISGTIPKKGAFSFSGNLTFTGDGTATFTTQTSTYIINLLTGIVTKK